MEQLTQLNEGQPYTYERNPDQDARRGAKHGPSANEVNGESPKARPCTPVLPGQLRLQRLERVRQGAGRALLTIAAPRPEVFREAFVDELVPTHSREIANPHCSAATVVNAPLEVVTALKQATGCICLPRFAHRSS
jgi:hypothetical protein